MKITDDIYTTDFLSSQSIQDKSDDTISEKDKFHAAKQILLGLAILYVITMLASFWKPDSATELLDICKTIYPPLATLILACYFRDKN